MNPMNLGPQLDLHPDAESLNAFVEQLLPVPERRQILAHMAACSRCRQVVFLAQAAAAEIEQKLPAPAPAQARVQPSASWFAKGRWAWVTAAAFPAILGVATAVYVRHTAQNAEQAKVFLPAQGADKTTPSASSVRPLRKQAPTRPSQLHPASAGLAPSAERSLAARRVEGTRAPGALDKVVPQPSASVSFKAPSSPPSQTSETVLVIPFTGIDNAKRPSPTENIPALSLNQQAMQSRNAPSGAALLQPPNPQGAVNGFAAKSAVAGSAQPTVHNAAARMQPGQAVAVSAGAAPMRPGTMQGSTSGTMLLKSANFAANLSAADMLAARRTLRTQLPSGLTAVSTAAAQHRLLAIDADGALFLSQDWGKTWVRVAHQWAGKAIDLRVPAEGSIDGATSSPGDLVSGEAVKALTRAPAQVLFEIVTDDASVWTSADGKTWKSK